MEGFLAKQMKLTAKWRRRLMRLERGNLSYDDPHTHHQQRKGQVLLLRRTSEGSDLATGKRGRLPGLDDIAGLLGA